MAVYNVDSIENWYDDFTSCKSKFQNDYLVDYQESCIRRCSDSPIVKMRKYLTEHYNKINMIYKNLDKYWKEYLEDLKNTDLCLAGMKSPASINASSISAKLIDMPHLEEYEADLSTKLASASADIGVSKKIGLSEDKTLIENIGTILEKTDATITTLGMSLVEGVTKLAEDAVDLIALSGATIATRYTGMIDLGNYILSEITGNEDYRTNYTKQMWEKTRAFVSEKYTKQVFDKFYDNTSAGKWMKNKAYGFDVVRDVGAEIGEVVGVVVLSAVTGGSAAVIYGVAKTAEHTEENWQDKNTSTFGGLVKGGFQGLLDGVFFDIGMKGDKIAQTAAKKVVEKGGKTVLKKSVILGGKMIFEGGTSVVQDCSSILVNTLFSSDSIMDENGQVITFDNFQDRWNYYYNQAGGTKGLVTSLATASALSFVSDSFDIYGVKNSNSAIRNADVDLNLNKTYAKDPQILGKQGLSYEQYATKNKVEIGNLSEVAPSNAINTSDLFDEYNRLLQETNQPWFKNAKEAIDNGYTWDLNDARNADNIVRRMSELEGALSIQKSAIPDSTIYNYSTAKRQADALAEQIRQKPIPGLENLDTNSDSYRRAMQELYSKPSASGTQILTIDDSPFMKKTDLNTTLTLDQLKYNGSSNSKYVSDYLKSNLNKFVYKDTNYFAGLNDEIKANGLFHLTGYSDEILSSGYIKSSGINASYGNPKTFFFNGIPSAGQVVSNLDDLPLRVESIKAIPTDEVLNSKKLKVRSLDDGAITYDGKFKFDSTDGNVTKEYLILCKQGDELVYKSVPKAVYDSYPGTIEGRQIADFLGDEKNIQAIRSDYYRELSIGRKKSKEIKQSDIFDFDKSSGEFVYESDVDLKNTGMNIQNHNSVNLSDIAVPEDKIKTFENAFGLDYNNDDHDKKIISTLYKLANRDFYADENVGKIVRNIDSISQVFPKFKIYETLDESYFRTLFGNPELVLSTGLFESSTDVISPTLTHEFGHAFLHLFKGDADNAFKFRLTEEKLTLMKSCKKKLQDNPETYIRYLKESLERFDIRTSETITWYDTIRPQENARISKMIEDLYSSGDNDEITKIAKDVANSKLDGVREILEESGIDKDEINDIISDKELLTKLAQTQNNISNQLKHRQQLFDDYNMDGDYRKISAVINSMTQKTEHIDPITGEKLVCPFGHRDEYWNRVSKEDSFRSSYDELCADYFSLSANGRSDVLDKMEEMFGTDIMNSIRQEFKDIADVLEARQLINK